jgi:TM2 domain-containing membrane protein YozV
VVSKFALETWRVPIQGCCRPRLFLHDVLALTRFQQRLELVMAAPEGPHYDAGAMQTTNTHSKAMGYVLWIFGFTGSHRFYFGKPVSGTIWFFTLGLLGIGWLIDLFLIPSMNRKAAQRFVSGPVNYSVAWILLTFLGLLGIHRFYVGKVLTGILYLLTVGLFGFGVLYDFWTLNAQISEINHAKLGATSAPPVLA